VEKLNWNVTKIQEIRKTKFRSKTSALLKRFSFSSAQWWKITWRLAGVGVKLFCVHTPRNCAALFACARLYALATVDMLQTLPMHIAWAEQSAQEARVGARAALIPPLPRRRCHARTDDDAALLIMLRRSFLATHNERMMSSAYVHAIPNLTHGEH
jgi:hypothetical protein